MKDFKTAFVFSIIVAVTNCQAQNSFVNLNFEAANLPPTSPSGPPTYVSDDSALPGWTAYIGSQMQSQALQNDYDLGSPNTGILGPNYPAAGPTPGGVTGEGVIDGHYTAVLQAGYLNGSTPETASLSQTGLIPAGDESLQFKAWQTTSTPFTASLDGNNLPLYVLGSGANYTLYGADISAYAGQTATLDFTALVPQSGSLSFLGLDDINFAPTSVPEPSPLVLTGIAGAMFAARYRWMRKKRKKRIA